MFLKSHKYQKVFILALLSVLLLITIKRIHKNDGQDASVSSSSEDGGDQEARHEQNLKEISSEYDPIIVEQADGVVVYQKSPRQRSKTPIANYEKEKATLFSLVRNSDLYGISHSIKQMEDRFNKNYHYDWMFVNDKPFTRHFKKVVSNLCSGDVKFVELTAEFWSYPDWIDQARAKEVREEMARKEIKYGDSESYRQMCRFNSGLFYKLPALANYKYYWRVEPDIEYHCDIDYDPFKYMKENNKYYGFNLAPLELHTTVTTLWDTVKNYSAEYPARVSADNNMEFLSDDGGETFNMCHFWSNFELGDLDFFRSDTYNHFFDYLDKAGGIYYERWGDAPIHSIAVSLLLPKDRLFFMKDTGYFHSPNGDCPRSFDLRLQKNCNCNPREDFTWGKKSCIPKFFDIHNLQRPNGAPTRKYKPIHNWEKVLAEDERKERIRLNKEARQKEEEDKAANLQRLEAGVEGEQEKQGQGQDIDNTKVAQNDASEQIQKDNTQNL